MYPSTGNASTCIATSYHHESHGSTQAEFTLAGMLQIRVGSSSGKVPSVGSGAVKI
jgi:hypothetical protein